MLPWPEEQRDLGLSSFRDEGSSFGLALFLADFSWLVCLPGIYLAFRFSGPCLSYKLATERDSVSELKIWISASFFCGSRKSFFAAFFAFFDGAISGSSLLTGFGESSFSCVFPSELRTA